MSESNDFVPHAMTDEEIDAYINIYADAAAVAKAAGADGVEIHCAHDSLPQSFMSPALCLTPITPGTASMMRARSCGDR